MIYILLSLPLTLLFLTLIHHLSLLHTYTLIQTLNHSNLTLQLLTWSTSASPLNLTPSDLFVTPTLENSIPSTPSEITLIDYTSTVKWFIPAPKKGSSTHK